MPYLNKRERFRQIGVLVKPEVFSKVREKCLEDGISIASLVNYALVLYLDGKLNASGDIKAEAAKRKQTRMRNPTK